MTVYRPRKPLPPLPALDSLTLNRKMAACLGIEKSTLLRGMHHLGIRDRREVRLRELLDLELTIGKAARLLGRSTRTLDRWVDRGIIKAIRRPGGYRRFVLRHVLERRQALRRGQFGP